MTKQNGGENSTVTITEQSVRSSVTIGDLMLIEIMRSVGTGELKVELCHGKPKAILVGSKN